jgi:hypothetical protein
LEQKFKITVDKEADKYLGILLTKMDEGSIKMQQSKLLKHYSMNLQMNNQKRPPHYNRVGKLTVQHYRRARELSWESLEVHGFNTASSVRGN